MGEARTVSLGAGTAAPGWLRERSFDLHFILGIAGLALLSGWAVLQDPRLFAPILFADLWLLGYHHVIATYTRLYFDAESRRTHRFLILWLPLLVAAGVAAVAFGVGLWALASVYLYWQWFHYTRQSWGIAQIYRRRSGGLVADNPHLAKLAFYLLPLWGILYRSYQDPGTFLGLPLVVVPVPAAVVELVSWAAMIALLWWIGVRIAAWRRRELPLAHTLYLLSHFTIFYVAYIAIESIDVGWLVVNIWHNAQYIVFVWLFNTNRFKDGPDPRARFLSAISQERNLWLYLLVCLGLSTAIYLAVDTVFSLLAVVPLMVVYQTLNFHHYIVDGVIWKVRRRSLQKTLGLAA